jgi:hypothetical protein
VGDSAAAARGSFDAPDTAGGLSSEAAPSSGSGIAAESLPDLDLDEAWPLALVVGALLLGAVSVGCVVWAAPALFAEVLLDAAVAGIVYRRARRHDRGHWIHGVLRRTWLPATALCGFAAAVGLALQRWTPGTRSLGDVFGAG